MGDTPVFTVSDEKNLELVRTIVLNRLKNDGEYTSLDVNWTEPNAKRFVVFDPAGVAPLFIKLANEVMWQLAVQGVIAPGSKRVSDPTFPHFHTTVYGKEVLDAQRPIPQDATRYLDEIRGITGHIETDVCIAYIEEALRCFNSGCNVASALLLGVASEAIFNGLCAIVRSSLKKDTDKKELDAGKPVKPRHRWLLKRYDALPGKTRRNELPEALRENLGGLYELIRRQRNKLGHPQENIPTLNREKAFLLFQLFPSYLEDVQRFAEYCKKNPI